MEQENNIVEQRSLEWFLSRWGKFSSSQIGLLMSKGRNGAEFSQTAMSYIFDIAAQRDVNPDFLSLEVGEDGACPFEILLARSKSSSREMLWGSDMEKFAADAYSKLTGNTVEQDGFRLHKSGLYGGSVDGVVFDKIGSKIAILEIKCPAAKQHLINRQLKTADDLMNENLQYYLQIQMNIELHNVEYGVFVSYDLTSRNPINILHIPRNQEIIYKAMERIEKANKIVNSLIA